MIRNLILGFLTAVAGVLAPAGTLRAQEQDTSRVATTSQAPEVQQAHGDDEYAVLPMSTTEEIFKTTFHHGDINGVVPQFLIIKEDPAPNYCADRNIREAKLLVRLKMGETDYEFAKNNDFIARVEVSITGNSPLGAPVYTQLCTLEISMLTPSLGPPQVKPEQLKVVDFTSDYDDIASFSITAKFIYLTSLPTTDLEDNIRLDVGYTEEFKFDPRKISDPAAPIVVLNSTGDIVSYNPVPFAWSIDPGEGCADQFPNYQLQILRLYNVDPAKTGETDITTKVDWSQALSYEVGSSAKTVQLTLPEGRGYYAWRVRPIGNLYPGAIANDRNWGVWSASLNNGVTVTISATNKPGMDAAVAPSIFFYNGFDENLNWIYSRNFTEGSEGTRVGEKMTYATSLLQPKQNQARIQSKASRFLVGQSVLDFSGRPTLVSLPAPVNQGGFGYRQGFLKHERSPGVQEPYTALNFDYDAAAASGGTRASNYKEPNSLNYGSVHGYYSDLNNDIQVPNADGYAFSRTILYPDGIGHPQERSGAGDVHRLKPATLTVDDRTVKNLYGTAPDPELIAMFGDEAPDAKSVQKIFTVDPNKVISVQYISKEGNTLATCLVKTAGAGASADLLDDLEQEQAYEEVVRDTVWNEPRQRRLVLPVATSVTLRYSITPNEIQAACGTYCSTCDYKVEFYIHDLQNPENTKSASINIDPRACGEDNYWPQTWTDTWALPAGTYMVERRITSNNPLDVNETQSVRYEEHHANQVRAALKSELDAVLDPVRAYLNDNDLEGLYTYLDSRPGTRIVNNEYLIETECCTLRVPIKECGAAECPNPLPDFEAMLYNKWSTWGNELNDFFWKKDGSDLYELPTPSNDNKGAFNAMIGHMIDDGYDCGRLLQAWEVLVSGFGENATKDGLGLPAQKKNDYNLLEAFLMAVGKKYEGYSNCPYNYCGGGKEGYLEYAYKYFQYSDGWSTECEDLTPSWSSRGSWGADPVEGPYENKKWEQFYNCYTGHSTGTDPSYDDYWMPNCPDKESDACLEAYAEAVEDSCRNICQDRLPGFIESVKEAYYRDGKVIEGDKYLADGKTLANSYNIPLYEVYCRAWALVMHCEGGCDLTITRNSSTSKIESIGTNAEREAMKKSMTYTYKVAIPDGENECPEGLYEVPAAPGRYAEFIVMKANQRLRILVSAGWFNPISSEYVIESMNNLFTQLVGPGDGCHLWEDSRAKKKDEDRSVQNSLDCPTQLPHILALGINILDAQFVLLDSCTLGYRRICLSGGVYDTTTVIVCGDLCDNPCTNSTCFAWVEPVIDPQIEIRAITCEEQASQTLRDIIEEQASACIDAQGDQIRLQYRQECMQPSDFGDTLSLEYESALYHFTLYYYDRAGNLVRTVPPNGADLSPRNRNTHPNHQFVTKYRHNSFKQLVAQITPDGGRTNYWHNAKGQLRLSQNAEQAKPGQPRFSYIKYDLLGRSIESGEAYVPLQSGVPADLTLPAESAGFPMMGKRQRTFTVYSASVTNYSGYLGNSARRQRYLQNRISYTHNDDGVATYYSYDPHGNVEWMEQWTPGLGGNYIGYKYDLISGNMLEVHYDSSIYDQFHHRYSYDGDNRLIKVETSRDGSIWDRDASYAYYDHGPLKNIQLGEDRLQQLDYTYTIQGWIKGINHPSLDPSKDPGLNGSGTNRYAPDAFGMILGYYEGDFKRKTGSDQSVFNSSDEGVYTRQTQDLQGGNLYNGNISSWTSNIIPAPNPPQPLQYEQLVGYTYRYDRLNRLLKSEFRPYDIGMAQWPSAASSEYRTETSYDPAGNIKTMKRTGYSDNGSNPLDMDDLTYIYQAQKNRLRRVQDAVTANNYQEDLDNQSESDNYKYDEIGNLISDDQEGVQIKWNVQGKIDQVWKKKGNLNINHRTYYGYNAAGNRVRKEYIDYANQANSKVTYYVRDANEQVIAIYEQAVGPGGVGGGTGDDCIAAEYWVVTNPDHVLDYDHDWIPDDCDRCSTTVDTWQEDFDGDGVPDACDNCPRVYNPRVGSSQPSCPGGGGGGGGGLQAELPWWQTSGGSPVVQHGWESSVGHSRGRLVLGTATLAEFLIDGTKTHGRFATMYPNEFRNTMDWLTDTYTRELTKKEYELKDHLGNVRGVVSDMKLNNGTSSGPDFKVDLRSYTNCYAFGMAEPRRSFAGNGYRYGYNGKEKDDELNGSGNSYDYGFRIYNPRLAKFISVDPLISSYPMLTPYQFGSNNPILNIDVDGLEGYSYFETMSLGDQVYGRKVIIELDIYVAISNNPQSVRFKASDIGQIASELNYEYNILGPGYWISDGGDYHKLEFKFNLHTFDGDQYDPPQFARQVNRNSTLSTESGSLIYPATVIDRVPKSQMSGSDGITYYNLATPGEWSYVHIDATLTGRQVGSTIAHEIGHVLTTYDPNILMSSESDHNKYGGIFTYKKYGVGGRVHEYPTVNMDNVKIFMKALPTASTKNQDVNRRDIPPVKSVDIPNQRIKPEWIDP